MRVIQTDCLVIGAGLAGSAYALHAARAGLDVQLLSLGGPSEANSDWAQGGIIFDTSAHPESLASDIMTASDGMANPAAIEQLVREGPAAVRELLLDELDIAFDRETGGELELTREGGHSQRRIIHAKDLTGHAILSSVADCVDATKNITRKMGSVAIDLLTLSHNTDKPVDRFEPLTCFGAYVLDGESGEPMAIVARKTILATGGLGQIFQHSTNRQGTVGHGYAMAYRVGARLIDLEYVQFHPTVFYAVNAPHFLITEALRGEGAVLVNGRGERFMDALHPRASLAPRDIVSRAIHHEMIHSGDACVYLDLSALKPDYIRERFPYIYRRCMEQGIDITTDTDSRCSGRTLFLRWCPHRPQWPHQRPPPERHRRNRLYGPAWRQPPRQHVAARMPDRVPNSPQRRILRISPRWIFVCRNPAPGKARIVTPTRRSSNRI